MGFNLMSKIDLAIGNGFYESFSKDVANLQSLNCYPQFPQTSGAVTREAIFPTSGIDRITTLSGACRGTYNFQDIMFSVNGNNLYLINENGSFVDKGIVSGSGQVSFADNGVTLSIVVPSGDCYFYNSDTLSLITDVVFLDYKAQVGGVTSVCSKDGYFIYTTKEEFFLSSLVTVNDGMNFDALDFSTAERKPDDIVRAMIVRGELYIFGTLTTEVFQNTGNTAFPFERISGASNDKGLTARFSVVEFDNSYVYIGSGAGESPSVWRGLSKISTSAIDNQLSNLTELELSDAIAFKYTENGSFFACFTFGKKTFVYDATASAIKGLPIWHQRGSESESYRVNSMVDVYGATYVGDKSESFIGKFNKNAYTEYLEIVDRQFITSYVSSDGTPLFVSELELKTESGVGAFSEKVIGVDPVINMSYSDDGGNNFINAGDKKIGKQGDYTKRQIWHRLGRIAYSRMFKFTISEPIKSVFIKLSLKIEGGNDS
jgi:hypothetical protein